MERRVSLPLPTPRGGPMLTCVYFSLLDTWLCFIFLFLFIDRISPKCHIQVVCVSATASGQRGSATPKVLGPLIEECEPRYGRSIDRGLFSLFLARDSHLLDQICHVFASSMFFVGFPSLLPATSTTPPNLSPQPGRRRALIDAPLFSRLGIERYWR